MAERTDDQQNEYTCIWDTTTTQQFCQALGQLCGLQSMNSIKVPSYDSYSDPYQFIIDFEDITSAFTDEQRALLVQKSFIHGSHNSWFELTLLPLIQAKSSWVKVKIAIVERFSDVKHDERHFITLRELRFVPEEKRSLLSFIEMMYYCFSKAFGPEHEDCAVRYIRAAIPRPVRSSLSIYRSVNNITSISELKLAAKQYDITRGTLM